MRRSHLLITLSVGLAAIAGTVLYKYQPWQPALEVPASSYTQNQDWAFLPEAPTDPVWLTGWKTDVFLILKQNQVSGKTLAMLEQNTLKARETSDVHASALSSYGAVYAPVLRAGYNDDAATALAAYLTQHNRGRAFIILSDETLAIDFTEAISAANALDRFGGYYFTNTESTSNSKASGLAICPTHLADLCTDTIAITITKTSVSAPNNSTNDLYSEFQTYLENDIRPMAEPFGDFEEVEVISVKKPSEAFQPKP